MISRWTSKFQLGEEEAIKDHMGKHGKQSGRAKVKYDSELEQLRAENLRLKGENFILKKLEEHLEKQKFGGFLNCLENYYALTSIHNF